MFGNDILSIELKEPLAVMAVRLAEEYALSKLDKWERARLSPDWTFDDTSKGLKNEAKEYAMYKVQAKAIDILRENNALYSSKSYSFRAIYVSQPHISKKGIMFTNLVLSTVIGQVTSFLISGLLTPIPGSLQKLSLSQSAAWPSTHV